jgi:dipeptidyl aminopeptidase/acylaminoacyl peptidase
MVSRAGRKPISRGAALLLASCLFLAGKAQGACSSLLPGAEPALSRDITAKDVIELREIGYPDGALSGASPLAVSPDGQSIAFVLTRADLDSNGYCRGLVVLPLERPEAARLVDLGGGFMPFRTFVRGLRVEVGLQQVVTPAWSPDGRSIALLKREAGTTQAVIVPLRAGGRAISTHSPVDVEAIRWSPDGTTLYFSSRPGLRSTAEAIDREGQSGWLYDDRFAPNYEARPRIRESDAPLVTFEFDPASGSVRQANKPPGGGSPPSMVSSGGRKASLQATATSPFAPRQIEAADARGRRFPCRAPSCRGHFLGLWWAPDGRQLWFLKREGWNGERTGLYRWNVSASAPVQVFSTLDVIQNCVVAESELACTVENSTTPRRIILIDPRSGTRRTIFDSNPEFASLKLGTVRRLRWRNDRGLEAWGDLVVPPNYRPGQKLPLIVVQYSSRGFLRGGTGNEYPIYPLAANGFAVLSFERPPDVASLRLDIRTEVELNAADEEGWAERRSMLSALLKGIDLAVATGAIDPTRIGITGLSDGATGARFALLNTHRFAAAAISSCCLEPKTVMTYGGIGWAEFNRAIGYPRANASDPDFWSPMSLALNAERMKTPLLIQQSDDEYLLSLEAVEALREAHAPVELYVFPDEHHVKWQPLHKLAVFERALDWFRFWLDCSEDPDPVKSLQYRRWRAMRADAREASSSCAAATSERVEQRSRLRLNHDASSASFKL